MIVSSLRVPILLLGQVIFFYPDSIKYISILGFADSTFRLGYLPIYYVASVENISIFEQVQVNCTHARNAASSILYKISDQTLVVCNFPKSSIFRESN